MLHNHNVSNALHQFFSAVALTLTLVFAAPAHSELIVTVVDSDRSGTPLSVQVFSGTITNTTGADIFASEVFANFNGFDSDVFEPIQLLANQSLGYPDFTIANGTTSALTDLFSVTLKAAALVGQTYSMDVLFQGPGIDFSESTVSIHVVPEPSATLLMLAGLLFAAVAVGARRRR